MANPGEVKFGALGIPVGGYTMGMGASEVISDKSGHFVKNDGSGRAEIAGDGHTDLLGWAELGAQTCSSTEGATLATIYRDCNCRFRIPLAYDNSTYTVNYSAALIGKSYDLIVISNVQHANLTTTSEKTITVVNGLAASSATADDGWVDVVLSPSKLVG
jgi:hypothetical protein